LALSKFLLGTFENFNLMKETRIENINKGKGIENKNKK
jgi:hypothetical protein